MDDCFLIGLMFLALSFFIPQDATSEVTTFCDLMILVHCGLQVICADAIRSRPSRRQRCKHTIPEYSNQ